MRRPRRAIRIDLPKALRDQGSRDNVMLQPGDSIMIPEYQHANREVRTRRHSFLFSSNPSPRPGSEVFVPTKDPNAPHTDTVALFGAIAQILASTVAIIVIATR